MNNVFFYLKILGECGPPSRNISVRVINCKFKKMSVTVFVFVSIYNYTDCIGVVLSLANVKLIWFVLLSPCDCIDLIVFLFTNIQSFKLVFAIVQSVSISIVLFKYTDCFGKMHKLYHKLEDDWPYKRLYIKLKLGNVQNINCRWWDKISVLTYMNIYLPDFIHTPNFHPTQN